jgi:thiamine biosynthesis lipoprotein
MKKVWMILNLILFAVLFSACSETLEDPSDPTLVDNTLAISSMGTFVSGTVSAPRQAWESAYQHIKDMYDFYHKLTDNYGGHEGVSGIYFINNLVNSTQIDQTVEIDKALYDILELSLELQVFTDGYFDISIGRIVDVWKELIDTYDFPGQEVPKELVDHALSVVENIPVIEDAVTLHTDAGKYYVTLKYGAKIDLGAIAKGYVTQLAVDYLIEQGFKTYLISGGGSSMLYGEGNPRTADGTYRTGLINPQDVINNLHILGHRPKNYGIYTSTNYDVTTSGSYNQFVLSENVMYHHIVSPKTKTPANYYLTVSIIGTDAGYNDALSTALFNMPPEVLASFVNTHNLEVYTYLFNNSFESYNQTSNFRAIS